MEAVALEEVEAGGEAPPVLAAVRSVPANEPHALTLGSPVIGLPPVSAQIVEKIPPAMMDVLRKSQAEMHSLQTKVAELEAQEAAMFAGYVFARGWSRDAYDIGANIEQGLIVANPKLVRGTVTAQKAAAA